MKDRSHLHRALADWASLTQEWAGLDIPDAASLAGLTEHHGLRFHPAYQACQRIAANALRLDDPDCPLDQATRTALIHSASPLILHGMLIGLHLATPTPWPEDDRLNPDHPDHPGTNDEEAR